MRLAPTYFVIGRMEAVNMTIPKTEFKPGWGTWFSNGTLRILTNIMLLVIRPWGDAAGAWHKTSKSQGWKHLRPNISLDPKQAKLSYKYANELIKTDKGIEETSQLVFPFRAMEEAEAWRQFFSNIPEYALTLARKYSSRPWSVLQTLNRCGSAAFDLADCPVLLFLIANNWVFGKRTSWIQRTSRRLCRIKRREAAAWLGFPDRESTIKAFRKIAQKSISVEFCFYLRNALNDANIRQYLMHTPRINKGVLRLLAPDLISHITPNLLAQVGLDKSEDNRPSSAYMIKDILSIIQLLRPDLRKTFSFKNKYKIAVVHDEWVKKLNETGYNLYESRYLNLEFPPMPDLWYPDSNILTIQPQTTPKDLIKLGRQESNCVASWAHRVTNGKCYIYKVVAKYEVATLAIHKSRGSWHVMDMLTANNEPASDETWSLVKEWLQLAQNKDASLMPWDFYDDDIPI